MPPKPGSFPTPPTGYFFSYGLEGQTGSLPEAIPVRWLTGSIPLQ